VQRSQEPVEDPSWVRANEVTLVVAGIGIIFPNIFDLIGNLEAFHPRIALRWQLARYSLIVLHSSDFILKAGNALQLTEF
jgi:hypothetical protein